MANALSNPFDDSLSAIGVAAGVFLALVGAATLAGMPWQYSGGSLQTGIQIVGSVAAVVLGAGLAWLATRD